MDETKADHFVWFWKNLEAELIKIFYHIAPYGAITKPLNSAFKGSNWKTWSPHLGRLIVDACGIIDSLVAYLIPDKENKSIGQIAKGKNALLDKISQELKWPDQKVIVLLSPPAYLLPYSPLNKNRSSKKPYWWDDNNIMKHDRIPNFDRATLESATLALAGALVAIITIPRYKESNKKYVRLGSAPIRRGWLNLENMSAEKIKQAKNDLEKGFCIDRFVETSLFAVSPNKQPLPGDVPDFDPLPLGGSIKLAGRLLGSNHGNNRV